MLADVIERLVYDEVARAMFVRDRSAFLEGVQLSPVEAKMLERLTGEVLAAFATYPDSRIDGGVAVWYGVESPLAR